MNTQPCSIIQKHRPQGVRTVRSLNNRRGFTLIEMMIVVAIIGLLLAFGIPGWNMAQKRAAIASVRGAADASLKALAIYTQRPGSIGVVPLTESTATAAFPGATGGTGATLSAAARLDTVFLAEGALRQPLQIKIGNMNNKPTPATGGVALNWDATSQTWTSTAAPTMDYSRVARLECRLVPSGNPAPSGAAGANFRLDGIAGLPVGSRVQYIVIPDVPNVEAAELANAMANFSEASPTAANDKGPVAYGIPNADTQLVDVYVYVSHQ